MKQTIEIAKRELKSLFLSPVGWIVLIIFTLQAGSNLSAGIQTRSFRVWSINEDIISLTFNFLFQGGNSLITGIASQLYLYIPLITMGLLSREFADGTIRLMFSSPVKIKDIVFGKYLAICIYGLAMVGIVAIFCLVLGLFVIDNIDIVLVLWALFLLYLVICTYAAIGLYISSLTSYPFVAAIGVIGVLLAFNYASTMTVDGMPDILASILIWFRGISFIFYFKGFVGMWDLLYFPLIITMFLGFTFIRLHSVQNIISWWKITLNYASVVLLVLTLGYVSSRPQFKVFTDTRRAEVLDTRILINREEAPKYRLIFMQLIPGSMLLISSVLIIRRRRK